MSIDLNACVPGQKLISKHGLVLTYVGSGSGAPGDYYDHYVKYPDQYAGLGTRTNE